MFQTTNQSQSLVRFEKPSMAKKQPMISHDPATDEVFPCCHAFLPYSCSDTSLEYPPQGALEHVPWYPCIYNVGPPSDVCWFIQPVNTTVIGIINHNVWSYVHQLSYPWGPTLYIYILSILYYNILNYIILYYIILN